MARALLQLEGFEVVGEAADALSALDAVRRLRPSVVLRRRGGWPCGCDRGRSSHLPARGAGAGGRDALVGLAFIGLGLVAWQRRPSSRSGSLMVATGFAWFAGSLAGAALFLHRGPLVHLLVGYPQGRLRSRLEQLVVTAAYVDGLVYPLPAGTSR